MAPWIEPLARELARVDACRDLDLRPATPHDEQALYALHREAMRDYVEATWGWNEEWQRAHFAVHYAPRRNAVIVRRDDDAPLDIGRLSLTLHWRWIFLRDIELIAAERNRGIGSAVVDAVIAMAAARAQHVELNVLACNPARRLYARLGFRIVSDDGVRLRMRT